MFPVFNSSSYVPYVKNIVVKSDSNDIVGILQWLDPGEKVTITYQSGGEYHVEFLSKILHVEDVKTFPTAVVLDKF